MKTIAVFVGSLRKDSFNRQLAQGIAEIGSDLFTFRFVALEDVPMFNQDKELEPCPAVEAMKQTVRDADAVLFVTPEYNRSIPAVLKNALDWCSRPAGKSVWGGKPAATAGTSPGNVGTAAVQQHLRSVMTMLGMEVMGQPELYIVCTPEFFDNAGHVANESTRKFFRMFLEKFDTWIDKVSV